MDITENSSIFAPTNRGVEQLVARQAHNLEVACSSPASATNSLLNFQKVFYFLNDQTQKTGYPIQRITGYK